MGIVQALGCALQVLTPVYVLCRIFVWIAHPPRKRGPEGDEPTIRKLQGPDRKD
jgi:hypothetical protein